MISSGIKTALELQEVLRPEISLARRCTDPLKRKAIYPGAPTSLISRERERKAPEEVVMSIGQRFIYTVRDIFILIAAAGLILPPFTYSKNAPPPTAEEDEDGPGQGDEHRADP